MSETLPYAIHDHSTPPVRSEVKREVQVDTIGPKEWDGLVPCFDDASVYQTREYEAVRSGERRISHLVLREAGQIVAAAQARIVHVPLVGGVAYIFRGPLWRRSDLPRNVDVWRQMLRALRAEYGEKRGLLVRIIPNEFDVPPSEIIAGLEEEGYRWTGAKRSRTFLLDLSPPLEDLKKSMRRTCRANVKKAMARSFDIVEGTDDALYQQFLAIYREMHARKGFRQFVDVEEFQQIQHELPLPLKMRIRTCALSGEVVAAAVYTTLGNTALEVFLATTRKALEVQAAYALLWTQMETFKEQGIRHFDLGGIDPDVNPGGYEFKRGFAGRDIQFVGEFQTCASLKSKLLVQTATRLRDYYRKRKIKANA